MKEMKSEVKKSIAVRNWKEQYDSELKGKLTIEIKREIAVLKQMEKLNSVL